MPAPSKPFSVVALYGTERVTLLEELNALIESTGALADGGFDYAELDGRSMTPNEILDACATAPFLAERRTVVVRRAHKLDKSATTALTKSLATVPPTALLILVIEPDDDVKDLSKIALVVAAGKVGKAIACESPQGAALVKQLIERAKKGGSELTKPGAEELANLVSGSLTLATAELEKLLLYAGGEKIDEQMVRSVASPSQSWKVFELLDAVTQGDLGNALKNLRYLLEETATPQEAAMRYLLPQLHRQVRLLWQARACLDENVAPENAQHLLPRGRNLANAHSYVRGKLTQAARKLSLAQVAGMLRSILEADMRLKGQLPSANATETLERLLAEMCEIVSGRTTAASL
jgi:DNA polymerase-3 subunit delta